MASMSRSLFRMIMTQALAPRFDTQLPSREHRSNSQVYHSSDNNQPAARLCSGRTPTASSLLPLYHPVSGSAAHRKDRKFQTNGAAKFAHDSSFRNSNK